ncbi:ABC transporter permease [Haloarchaeobius amylolyticus]|uniref:ABC transporter permease n=1 Tax=Haloarchaeobius amylolyticus TaxID=1198296 RepID=UPI00227224F7|nr:ABC transporter permease [Haloarchaeobius amylolyticus]
MSWLVVARKDFQDAVRSRVLWVVSALFILLMAGMVAVFSLTEGLLTAGGQGGGPGAAPGAAGVNFGPFIFLASATTLFVTITALVTCHKSIAGERDSGSMKLLLGLPHSRRDVLVGKTVGRTAVLALPVLLGFLVSYLVAVGYGVDFPLAEYVLFALLTVLFAFVYVSIVVGVSATTGSSSRATTLAIGIFFVFEIMWDVVPTGVLFLVNGFSLPVNPANYPAWYFLVTWVAPSGAYNAAREAVLPESAAVSLPADAWFLDPAVGFLFLGFWVVASLGVGYRRFERADL